MLKHSKKAVLKFGRRCTVDEIAALLGLGRATVNRDMASGLVDLRDILSIARYIHHRRGDLFAVAIAMDRERRNPPGL